MGRMDGGKDLHGGARAWADVRLTLQGGFRVERTVPVPETAWQQRRSAKMLVKLLALTPGHSLHREQILDMLWPEVDFTSAVNSFGKALHVARRALEPNMASRGTSSYLRLVDDVLTLVTDKVWIDADEFERTALEALRRGDKTWLKRALELYRGELLPEDMYENWTLLRRDALADLHLRVLLEMAAVCERQSDRQGAIGYLKQITQLDPGREDVHRRLMRLYVQSGQRLLALRQYAACQDALREELDAEPDSATRQLYEDIRAGRLEVEDLAVDLPPAWAGHPPLRPFHPGASPRFVGRGTTLSCLEQDVARAEEGHGCAILISGEPGVGKSRLMLETVNRAADSGAVVLWGTGLVHDDVLPYAPFAEAIEMYCARCQATERQELAARYPELTGIVPSLALGSEPGSAPPARGMDRRSYFGAIVEFLTNLAEKQVVVLAIDDVHGVSHDTMQLLEHLFHLAGQRRWFILCAYQEEELEAGSDLTRVLSSTTRKGYSAHLHLCRLPRNEADELAEEMLESGAASSELLEQLYSLSLGNPLFMAELLGVLRGCGQLELEDGLWHVTAPVLTNLPRRVRLSVGQRVERLGDLTSQILALLAVAGPDLSFVELYQAARDTVDSTMTQTDLLDALDLALARGILEERGDGFAFTHPLFRAVVYDGISRPRRTIHVDAIERAVREHRSQEPQALASHYARNLLADKSIAMLQPTLDHVRLLAEWSSEDNGIQNAVAELRFLDRNGDVKGALSAFRSLVQQEFGGLVSLSSGQYMPSRGEVRREPA